MCGGPGGLFGGGGIGGILGGLLGSIVAPELGIPLALASGAGSFLGTTAGDLVSGQPLGTSLEQGAIGGLTAGALAGAGNVAAGGDFFGPSAVGFLGGSAPAAAAADTLAGSTTAATTGAALPAAAANLASAAPAAATTVAPAVGVGGGGATLGGDIGSIGGSVGSTPASVAGAVGGGGVGAGGASTVPATYAEAASKFWGEGLTGGDVGGAGPIPTGDSGSLTSFMSPLDSSSVGPLGRGDLSLNLTPGVQTPSVQTASPLPRVGGVIPPPATGAPTSLTTGLTQPLGYSGLTPAQIGQVNTQGFFMNPDAVTPYAAGTAGAPSVPGSSGGLWSWLTKGGSSPLSKGLVGEPGSILGDLTKPSNLITGGAALLPLLQGNTIPGLSNIQNQAMTYNAMGTPLAQALNTGNLPAGAQSSLDAQTRAASAAVRSRFAQMGLSGSSQEADALAGVDAQAAGQKVKMLGDVTQVGLSEMARADPLLQNIMTTRLAQDQQQQQAIARLAAALAGSTGTEKTTA